MKVKINMRKLKVLIDVERMEEGKFEKNILKRIRKEKKLIIVIKKNDLDS
jgi:hypothetical protein